LVERPLGRSTVLPEQREGRIIQSFSAASTLVLRSLKNYLLPPTQPQKGRLKTSPQSRNYLFLRSF
ncbi:hypothetical protein, partial [Accumulibacter sp.]|uniref:hypothetical protein n=1 Tax=Accumulibacter sp. TaxID=2053492 RepID=UPI0028C470C2